MDSLLGLNAFQIDPISASDIPRVMICSILPSLFITKVVGIGLMPYASLRLSFRSSSDWES